MYTWEGDSAVKNKINRRSQQSQSGNGSKIQAAKIEEITDLGFPRENQKMSRSTIKRNLLYMSDDDLEVEDGYDDKDIGEKINRSTPIKEKMVSYERKKIFPRPKFTDLPVPNNHLLRDNNFVDHKILQNFLNIHKLSREKSLSNPELYKSHEKRVSKYIYPREVPKSQKTVLSRNLSQTKLKDSHGEQERELEVCEVIPDHLILTKR